MRYTLEVVIEKLNHFMMQGRAPINGKLRRFETLFIAQKAYCYYLNVAKNRMKVVIIILSSIYFSYRLAISAGLKNIKFSRYT